MIYEDYITWFKRKIETYLSGKYGSNENNELTINIGYHKEYRYAQLNANNSIADFTFIFITGNIQQKINQRPIQILCEVEDKYCFDVLEALDNLALDMNEEIITLGNMKFRSYFNTPTFTQKFVEYGARRRQILSMDASIILFKNILNISKLEIKYDMSSYEEVKFSTFNIVYEINDKSTGATTDYKTKSVADSCANVVNVSAVCKNTTLFNKLIKQAFECNNPNNTCAVKITTSANAVYTYNAIVKQIAFNDEVQTFPSLQFSLLRKDGD